MVRTVVGAMAWTVVRTVLWRAWRHIPRVVVTRIVVVVVVPIVPIVVPWVVAYVPIPIVPRVARISPP